jgi:hypothetical protein
VKRLSILTFFVLFGNIALPTQAYANAISYSISSPNLIASTFKVGGQLDFTFSVTTNDPKPEPVYCYIDGFINPFEAVLISGTKNNGEFSCKSLIPNKPFELRSSGTYPLDVLVVYFTEFGKQDLRQTFGYLSFAAPAPTISYSISSPNLIASTFKVGGQLDFSFSVITNDPKPEPVYCAIDGFINPFEAVLISGTKNNGEFSCGSSIPNKPMELLGIYPLEVIIVYFDEFGKQDLRQTFGFISFATPTPTPNLTPAPALCSREGVRINLASQIYICVDVDGLLNFLPQIEGERLLIIKKEKIRILNKASELIYLLKSASKKNIRNEIRITVQDSISEISQYESKYRDSKIVQFDSISADNEVQILEKKVVSIMTIIASQKVTISCKKGKLVKKITAVNPKCPSGYKKA